MKGEKKTNLWHFPSSVTQKNYTQSPKTLTKKKEKKKEITKPTNENNPTMLSQKTNNNQKKKVIKELGFTKCSFVCVS